MKKLIKLIIFVCLLTVVIYFGSAKVAERLYPRDYSDFVTAYCDEYGVDEDYVYAVIKCESGFDPNAKSGVGALGLMQITPETFDWVQTKLNGKAELADDALYDPETNIRYGVYLLKLHLDEFGDPALASAAYHAGRGKVNSWLVDPDLKLDGDSIDEIPYGDTRTYVKRVIRTKKIYDKLYYGKEDK